MAWFRWDVWWRKGCTTVAECTQREVIADSRQRARG
jgi:hypothetical protein